MHGVKHVDFQEDLISDAVSKERHALDKRDMPNIDRFAIIGVTSVGSSKGVVNGGTKRNDIGVDCMLSALDLRSSRLLPTSIFI